MRLDAVKRCKHLAANVTGAPLTADKRFYVVKARNIDSTTDLDRWWMGTSQTPFSPSRSLTHILSASTVLVDTTWWQTNFTKEILNLCPLQCACTTAVKRHDRILGLVMRTDTCVCFPCLFDSEKEGYTKETTTTVHGKRTGWLLRFLPILICRNIYISLLFFFYKFTKNWPWSLLTLTVVLRDTFATCAF